MSIVEFLMARIAEDEAAAVEAGSGRWASWNRSWDTDSVRDIADQSATSGNPRLFAVPTEYDEHIARHDPARVLAECEAKRRIVEEARDYSPELADGDNGEWAFDKVLTLLALPYADHPDFREEWRL